MQIEMTIESLTGRSPATLDIRQLVIAGWAGRDVEAMEHHIAELEALGIARPRAMPTFYRVSASRLTTAPDIQIPGESASGEAETVLFIHDGRLHVGLGSDHTDREVEAYGVTVSKQVCDKPVAARAWPFEEVAPHWDRLLLRSWMTIDGERRLYQEGSVSGLLRPEDLIRKYTGGHDTLPAGTAMFGGTLGAIGGVKSGLDFACELEDPVLSRRITLAYRVEPLPVAD